MPSLVGLLRVDRMCLGTLLAMCELNFQRKAVESGSEPREPLNEAGLDGN